MVVERNHMGSTVTESEWMLHYRVSTVDENELELLSEGALKVEKKSTRREHWKTFIVPLILFQCTPQFSSHPLSVKASRRKNAQLSRGTNTLVLRLFIFSIDNRIFFLFLTTHKRLFSFCWSPKQDIFLPLITNVEHFFTLTDQRCWAFYYCRPAI